MNHPRKRFRYFYPSFFSFWKTLGLLALVCSGLFLLLLAWFGSQKGVFSFVFFEKTLFLIWILFAMFLFLSSLWWQKYLLEPLWELKEKLSLFKKHPTWLSNFSEQRVESFFTSQTKELSELEKTLQILYLALQKRTSQLETYYQELQTTVEQVSEAIVVVDSDLNIIYKNKNFSLLAPTPPPYDSDLNLKMWFREPFLEKAFQKVFSKKETIQIEWNYLHPNLEEKRTYALLLSPIWISKKHSTPSRVIGFFHDLSFWKETQKIRTEFISHASHELKTPLTVLKGFAQVIDKALRKDPKDFNQVQESFPYLYKNIIRLENLVLDLLTLNQLETGTSPQKEQLSTEKITENLLKFYAQKYPDLFKEVSCTFEAQSVFASEKRMEQVLGNLLDNALKYVPKPRKIHIHWKEDPKQAFLIIKDNGPGISEKHLSRLFERFYRIDPSRSRSLGGTGLGLSIVKHAMKDLGGTATVQSQLGKGTVFTCVFPKKKTF